MKSPIYATMKNGNYLPKVLPKMEAEEKEAFASIELTRRDVLQKVQLRNVALKTNDKEQVLPSVCKILSGCTATRLLELAPKMVEQRVLKGMKLWKKLKVQLK